MDQESSKKYHTLKCLTYDSELTVDQVNEKVRLSIQGQPVSRRPSYIEHSNDKPFRGQISNGRFSIRLILTHLGPPPTVFGSISPKENGSRIQINIKIENNVRVYMFILVLAIAFSILAQIDEFKNSFVLSILALLVVSLLARYLVKKYFIYQSKRTQSTFERIVGAQPQHNFD